MTEQRHDDGTPGDSPVPSPPAGAPSSGAPPETGDLVIDAALGDLAAAPVDDLDAQLEAGEAVHRTLQSRLTDLGG